MLFLSLIDCEQFCNKIFPYKSKWHTLINRPAKRYHFFRLFFGKFICTKQTDIIVVTVSSIFIIITFATWELHSIVIAIMSKDPLCKKLRRRKEKCCRQKLRVNVFACCLRLSRARKVFITIEFRSLRIECKFFPVLLSIVKCNEGLEANKKEREVILLRVLEWWWRGIMMMKLMWCRYSFFFLQNSNIIAEGKLKVDLRTGVKIFCFSLLLSKLIVEFCVPRDFEIDIVRRKNNSRTIKLKFLNNARNLWI